MSDLSTLAGKYFCTAFDGVIRIELEGGNTSLWIDGRQSPPLISESAPANLAGAFCLWRTSKETISRIFSPGVRQLESAYVAGRLDISGDMSVMTRLEVGSK